MAGSLKLCVEMSFGFWGPFCLVDLGDSLTCLSGFAEAARFLFFKTGSTFLAIFDGVEVGLEADFYWALAATLVTGLACCFVAGCMVFIGDLSLYA